MVDSYPSLVSIGCLCDLALLNNTQGGRLTKWGWIWMLMKMAVLILGLQRS